MTSPQAAPRSQPTASQTPLLVLAATAAGGLVAALLVYGLNAAGVAVMLGAPGGFNPGVIPIGLIASSGALAASWRFRRRIGGALLAGVLLVTAGGFLLCEAAEYGGDAAGRSDDSAGFFDYVFGTETEKDDGPSPAARGLELLIFSLGVLVGPAVLGLRRSACAKCGAYEKTIEVGLVPAGVGPASGQTAFTSVGVSGDVAQQRARQQADNALAAIHAAAKKGFPGMLAQAIEANGPLKLRAQVEQMSQRIRVDVVECSCAEGKLNATMVTGQPPQLVEKKIWTVPLAQTALQGLELRAARAPAPAPGPGKPGGKTGQKSA